MKRTQRRAWLAGAAASALAVTLLPATPATADSGSPTVTVEVVADELNVPRGVVYDEYLERVLVAEAGNADGNDGACAPAFGGDIYCYGETGSVYQHSENWWLNSERIVTGLPSIWAPDLEQFGFEVVLGLHDVALPWGTGDPVGVFGLSGPKSFRDALASSHPRAAELATLGQLNGDGSVDVIADFAQHEQNQNPHPDFIDTNPYGVSADEFDIVVADAAGNYVGQTDVNEQLDTLGVIPNYVDENGDEWEGVPLTITHGPDGAYYIAELSAAFSPSQVARIWRLDQHGALTLVAGGFNSISSLTFDHQGRMVVLEFADGYYTGGREGRLLRLEDDGSTTVLLDGLHTPGGVVEADPGVFYVTNRSASLGGDGELLRVTVGS